MIKGVINSRKNLVTIDYNNDLKSLIFLATRDLALTIINTMAVLTKPKRF